MALMIKLTMSELAEIQARLKWSIKESEEYMRKYPELSEAEQANINELKALVDKLEGQWQNYLKGKDNE